MASTFPNLLKENFKNFCFNLLTFEGKQLSEIVFAMGFSGKYGVYTLENCYMEQWSWMLFKVNRGDEFYFK